MMLAFTASLPATAGPGGSQPATVGQLVVTALITAVASVVGSLALAALTFRFVRRKELAVQLQNTIDAKSTELEQSHANALDAKSRELQQQHANALDAKTRELTQSLENQLAAENARRSMDRAERTRQTLVESAGPLLVAVEDLLGRMRNILDDQGYPQLASDWNRKRPATFSSTHEYFMASTAYVFARYFARASILRDRLGRSELDARGSALVESLREASDGLLQWPAPFQKTCTGQDLQLFSWQQRALGDSVQRQDGDRVDVVSYAEFLDLMPRLTQHLQPLQDLLRDLQAEPSNCRWMRLQAFRSALTTVRDRCIAVLELEQLQPKQSR
jgi:hypothetical protein